MSKRVKRFAAFVFIAFLLFHITTSKKAVAQEYQFDISQWGYARSDYNISQNDSGYVVAVWYDHRNSNLYEGDELAGAVYGQILDPDLRPIGSNFRISEPIENGIARQPDVLLLNNGNYIVVWNESKRVGENNSSQRRIVMTMRTLEGEVIKPETTVNKGPEQVGIFSPSIYKLSEEKFLITWDEPSREGEMGQYFFSDSTPDRENVSLSHPSLNLSPSGIYVVNDATYFLSYLDGPLVNGANQWIQYYDSTHTRMGEPIQLEQQGRITPFGTDTLLIINISENQNQLFFQFLNSNGKILSDPKLINDDGDIYQKTAPLAARNPGNGSFVITWKEGRTSSPIAGDVHAQRYDAVGNSIGTNFKVNHEEELYSQIDHNIQYRSDNTFLISWWEQRFILCPPPPPGVVIGNRTDSYITATLLEYDNPDPAPELEWVDPETRCENWEAPIPFEIKQNFPNPFNSSTNIVLDVSPGFIIDIEIEIFDRIGRKVAHLRRDRVGQGVRHIPFDASGLASGVYIARISTPNTDGSLTQTITMLHIK